MISERLSHRSNIVKALQSYQLGQKCKQALERFAEIKVATNSCCNTRYDVRAKSTYLIAFSPDRSTVASSHGDHTIKIFSLKTGKLIKSLHGHSRTAWCLSYHPILSNIVASGSLAGEIRVWDLNNGSCQCFDITEGNVISSISFHGDNEMLAAASGNKLYFLNWRSGKVIHTLATASAQEYIRVFRFGSSSEWMLTGILNNPEDKEQSLGDVGIQRNPVYGRHTVQTVSCHRLEDRSTTATTISSTVTTSNVSSSSMHAETRQIPSRDYPSPDQVSTHNTSTGQVSTNRASRRITLNRIETERGSGRDGTRGNCNQNRLRSRHSPFGRFFRIGEEGPTESETVERGNEVSSNAERHVSFERSRGIATNVSAEISTSVGSVTATNATTNVFMDIATAVTADFTTIGSTGVTATDAAASACADITTAVTADATTVASTRVTETDAAASASTDITTAVTADATTVASTRVTETDAAASASTDIAAVITTDATTDSSADVTETNLVNNGSIDVPTAFTAAVATDVTANTSRYGLTSATIGVDSTNHAAVQTDNCTSNASSDFDRNAFDSSNDSMNAPGINTGVSTRRSNSGSIERSGLRQRRRRGSSTLSQPSRVWTNLNSFDRPFRSEIWNVDMGQGDAEVFASQVTIASTNSSQSLGDLALASRSAIPVYSFISYPSDARYSSSISGIEPDGHAIATATARTPRHVHTAVVIAGSNENESENALRTAINRAIAGAFAGNGEGAVAANIVNTTYRLQLWDLGDDVIADLTQSKKNVIVPHCKLHNDGSIDVSHDGTLLAAYVPSTQGFPQNGFVCVFSLRKESLGQCVYSRSYGPNLVCVSFSPLNNFLLVGLASWRVILSTGSEELMGQVLKLPDKEDTPTPHDDDTLPVVLNVVHPKKEIYRSSVSVNTAKFHPSPGVGVIYGTNHGTVRHCRVGAKVLKKKLSFH